MRKSTTIYSPTKMLDLSDFDETGTDKSEIERILFF